MALLGKGANKSVVSSNHIGNIGRTLVDRYFDWRSTFSAGSLIPFYAEEMYPGQNKSIDFGQLIRSITPLGPVMDKSFLDVFFFFVPNRLLWDHWEEFIAGYNKEAWAQDVEYTVPKINFDTVELDVGDTIDKHKNDFIHSFLDYLPGACDVNELVNGIYYENGGTGPNYYEVDEEVTALNPFVISALFPRAYVKIWNDWFRDENLQDELVLYTGDNTESAQQFTSFNLLDPKALPKAAKYHNRFTSCLPSPTKGPDVLIPMKGLQIRNNAVLPVGVTASTTTTSTGGSNAQIPSGTDLVNGKFSQLKTVGASTNNRDVYAVTKDVKIDNVTNTIRMLRLATQTELLLSRDARGGTRYVESLLSHWSVHNGDARLQRSEYLGSKQIPLQVQQVTNTSQAGDGVLGNVGGQSVTRDNGHYFNYAATEYGIVFGVMVVRTNLSYSSGVRKQYQRFGRFDFIWPEFRHIGDVPCYTRELEININLSGDGDHVFGYTPYGSELREGYNFNNGLFRYKADGSLDYLTYQEKYLEDNPPYLSGSWIEQPSDVVSDTLVDQNGPQYYGLFELRSRDIIPLDPTSDPGLMDHF